MPRKTCYWTRKLELQLVEFIKQRDYIWKPVGNTNHHIQQKYKAYAEFAASLGSGFSARSVRDRWVNIRSTFNHNLRRVYRSKAKVNSTEDVYVPCWPLWKPLQFLRDVARKDNNGDDAGNYENPKYFSPVKLNLNVKNEPEELYEPELLELRQRSERPRPKKSKKRKRNNKCKRVLQDLVTAMKPISSESSQEQPYWFLGKHITERLNAMSYENAESASSEIMKMLDEWPQQGIDVT